ncbi:MAG TPA: class I SAM-dependent methyltransferase [Gammaproteobacteria bacterium]|nr:class I SAM-dependent methyltransferase [Gammaproteobacteria bacterium]
MMCSAEAFNDYSGVNSIGWDNKDLIEYYENVPVSVLRDFAIKGGFENGCDIDLIYPYIANTRSIIDVGSAYGRVLNQLILKKYSGKISSIERSKNLYKHLLNKYSKKVNIYNADIRCFHPNAQYEAVLFLWSGIGDFAKSEQLPLLEHMRSWLKPEGIMILDTILNTIVPGNASVNDDNSFILNSAYGTAYGYKPSEKEIDEYGKQLKFKYIKHIPYQTPTQRQRILHIFSNHPLKKLSR